jgi:hypothetical protein
VYESTNIPKTYYQVGLLATNLSDKPHSVYHRNTKHYPAHPTRTTYALCLSLVFSQVAGEKIVYLTIFVFFFLIITILRAQFKFKECLYGKGKGHPITLHQEPRGGVEVRLYSFSISALGGGGWSAPHPTVLSPEKTRYSLYRRLGGPQGRSGHVQKISPPPGLDPRSVQPVASRFID